VLEALLDVYGTTPSLEARQNVVVSARPARFELRALRSRLDNIPAGGCVAYAVRLDGHLLARIATLALLPVHLWRVRRTIERSGAQVVGRYGVDPNLDAPAFLYELNTLAADYARRYLRPRGSLEALRAIVGRLVGCDPALGAVVLVAKKD
jgi:hypothetical protein